MGRWVGGWVEETYLVAFSIDCELVYLIRDNEEAGVGGDEGGETLHLFPGEDLTRRVVGTVGRWVVKKVKGKEAVRMSYCELGVWVGR